MQSYELVHTRSGVEWNRGQSFRDTRGMTLRFSDPKQLRELQKSRDVQFHIQQDAYGLYILSHFEPVQDYYIHPLRVKVFCVFLVLFQLFALVVMTPGAFSLDKDYRLISRGVRYEWFPFSGIPAHMVFLADQIYHAPPLMHVIEALAMMTLVFQVVTESRGHLRCLILSSLREEDALGGGSKQGGQEVTPLGRHRSSFEYFEDASPVHPSRSRFPSGMDEEEGEGEGGKETMEGWREIWGRRLASLFRIFFVGFLGCFVMPFCLVVCGLTLILQSKTEGEALLNGFKVLFIAELDDYAVKFFQSLLPERSTTSKEKGGEQDDKWKYNKKRTQFRIVINRRAARLVASHLFELTLFFLPLTCGPILIPWFLFGLRKHALFIPAFKDLEYSHVLLDMAYVPLAVGAQGFAAATNLSLLYCFFGKNAAKGSADANDRGSIMGTSYAPTETVAGGVAGQGDEEEGCNTLVPLSSSHVEPVQPMKLEGDKGGDGTESEEAEEEREEEGVSSFFANTSPVRVLVMFCFGIWSSLFFLSAISRTAVLVHLLGWPLIGFYTFLLRHAIRLHQSGTGFVRLESYYVFFVVGFAVLNVFALIVALSTPQLAALLPPLDQYAMENAEGGTSAKVVKET